MLELKMHDPSKWSPAICRRAQIDRRETPAGVKCGWITADKKCSKQDPPAECHYLSRGWPVEAL
jgi:hypothetical protein